MPRSLLTCADLGSTPDRARVTVAGLVITRQRPGTASGVIFITLEDETGVANVIVWPKTYEKFRRAVISGRLLRVTGELQCEGSVRHLIAWKIESLSALLDQLGLPADPDAARADETRRPGGDPRGAPARGAMTPAAKATRPAPRPQHPRDQAKRLFPSRDFH